MAEMLLWEKLRGRQLAGFKIRRQHPIKNYIADFYCHEALLVIEVDGDIHEIKENISYDIGRTEEFDKMGIKVLRFKNEDVLHKMDEVLEQIKINLTSRPLSSRRGAEKVKCCSFLSPSPGGEARPDECRSDGDLG